MRKRKIRNIIWDWNGTLLDDMTTCIECMNVLLSKRSMPILSDDHYREIFTFPVRDYFVRVGFDFSKENFTVPAAEFVELYNSKYMESGLFSEAGGSLQQFSDQGFRQFILSAQEQSLLTKLIRYYDIEEFFDAVKGISDNYAASKVDAGKQMMAQFQLDPEESIMIGDTTHDFEVSQSLGTHCILISHGHQSPDRLRETGVPVLESFFEIEEYLSRNLTWVPQR